MARMTRLKSLKLKDEDAKKKKKEDEEDEEEEEDMDTREEGTMNSCGARLRVLVWYVGWAAISAHLGYDLAKSDARSSNAMWVNNLFSEYLPPRRMHDILFESRRLLISMGAENGTGRADVWEPPDGKVFQQCVQADASPSPLVSTEHNGYMQVFCTGGLFQLHICVCNAVAVAKMMNATLLIPYFRDSNVWHDPSKFHDIYDVDHFISYLKEDVQIVKNLPTEFEFSTPEYYGEKCPERPNCFVWMPKHSTKDWYMANLLPLLKSFGVVAIERYHHKLSFDGLPEEIVKLRCRTNFHALRFVDPIINLSGVILSRIRKKAIFHGEISSLPESVTNQTSTNTSQNWWELWKRKLMTVELPLETTAGRFIGLHIRFEKDMIAHSSCYYNGGLAEKRALIAYRQNVFKNHVAKARFHPSYLRMNGSCPLTPEEMGLLLAGLGFKNTTIVYTAGKSIYGGEARLKPLRDLFPMLENKESLTTDEELQPFLLYAHKLAALDFLVLLNSNVFMSNSAGNFPNVLTGHRTFFGMRKSIHPDKAVIAKLLNNTALGWKEFCEQVTNAHEARMGGPVIRRQKYSVYRYPIPDCMCTHP